MVMKYGSLSYVFYEILDFNGGLSLKEITTTREIFLIRSLMKNNFPYHLKDRNLIGLYPIKHFYLYEIR